MGSQSSKDSQASSSACMIDDKIEKNNISSFIPPPTPPMRMVSDTTDGTADDASPECSPRNNTSSSNINTSINGMKDEYGKMDASGNIFYSTNFQLESGDILPELHVCYNTYGELNANKDNVIVVCHALTGNSRVDLWWGELLGPGKALDTAKYMIFCANILGSCYGSSGPTSVNPASGSAYGITFPAVSIRDTVKAHMLTLRSSLDVRLVQCVVGGSMGGMQAIEWAIIGQQFVRRAVVIGCGASHSAWQIGFSETQRRAIANDPHWRGGIVDPDMPPRAGLALARQIAMMSYRTADAYHNKFGRSVDDSGRWQVGRYLEYQGDKFLDRFDAVSYVKITEQMDSHDVGRGRGGEKCALKELECAVVVMGIDSDLLYPVDEQKRLADMITKSVFEIIRSRDGHDGFLLEHQQVGDVISHFLAECY